MVDRYPLPSSGRKDNGVDVRYDQGLFLCGSAYGFASVALNLYQALLLKPDKGRSGLPLTRIDWYRGNDKMTKTGDAR
jgi:hypothetical protein